MSLQVKKRISLLCKIFLIGLLFQFFVQTFVTFQLGWDGKIWSAIWMWKEVILLLFVVAILYALISNAKTFLTALKKLEGATLWQKVTLLFGKQVVLQFIALFVATFLVFGVFALLIQKSGLSTFVLSIKYDLLPFFIFGLGICVALLFFEEKDKDLLALYQKIILYTLGFGLLRWLMLYFMPNLLKFFGYDWLIYEGTIGSRPPAAYYTQINKGFVRNQFLFERPISFGFWLIGFFPVFALGFLKNLSLKKKILWTIPFGLLVLSTWSRAAIGVFGLELIAIALILYWKRIRNYLWLVITVCLVGGVGVLYFGNRYFAREHSNTGHLVLVQEGRKMAKHNLITGRGAGYSGPASHQICYTEQELGAYTDETISEDPRCQEIRAVNRKHMISTYGYNPENQYLQIIMEYGLVGFFFWGALLVRILYTTLRTIWKYRKTKKSTYQSLLYYTLLGFGIGLTGLCIEGIVLHSLVDRMVVYPFFLLYGITLGLWQKEKDVPHIEVKTEKKKKKHKLKTEKRKTKEPPASSKSTRGGKKGKKKHSKAGKKKGKKSAR